VALARLFMQPSASVWILDEPYDALDADATALLDEALRAHAAAGGGAVLTSHIDLSPHGLPTVPLQLEPAATR